MWSTLEDRVVVITGASSGIGRAAALAFARRGSRVVAAARRQQALEEIVEECRRESGREAIAVPTDVSDEAAVEELARKAAESFGRIDVWVNNAAVTLFGRFEETPADDFRRVLDINLNGYVYGARAALPHFREQGGGVLINNGSIVGIVGQPYTSAYCLSKFAIRGLGQCLRQELIDDPIFVSTVLPAAIDTPIFHTAANYSGRAARPLEPVYDAPQVAEAIVWLARHPVRELIVGNSGRMLAALHTLSPGLAERVMARKVAREHLQPIPVDPTPGNLFEPDPKWTSISGGWKPEPPRRLPAALRPARVGAATLALAALAGVLVATTRR